MMIRLLKIFAFIALPLISATGLAQNPLSATDGPVEITADEAIDWNRSQNEYRATGNVVAIQNNVTVRGNELIAEYDQDPQNITQLIARDNVTIQTPEITARADQAVYQIPDQLLTLTGYDLRLTTPTETIMARDRMTFDRGQNRARAIGNAVINTGDTTLRADQLTGNFIKKTDGDNGNLALQSVRADGNIVIRTATEVVRGQRGIYNRQDQTAEIRGKVKITRGDNQLNGDRAIVNLVSGDSRLIGGTDAGGAVDDGRVRALIGNTETTNDDGGQDE